MKTRVGRKALLAGSRWEGEGSNEEGMASRRRPDYTEVLYRIGEAERLRGDRERATAAYERFLAAGGSAGLLDEARRRIRELGRC